MARDTLADWLQWLEGVHPTEIDLGLDRITAVADRMGLRPVQVPVVTVAGTNGKGSTVACLESMFIAAGETPGVYTSPHLLDYNERIRIGGLPVADEQILQAFAAIDHARAEVTLTYFEFSTLAAAWCFRESAVSPWILEVGLGGRLDATNCFDADVAVVTRIDLDHMEWLGDNREAIAGEKMGIARAGRPVVCADPDPPRRIAEQADSLGAPCWQLGVDYHCRRTADGWSWQSDVRRLDALPCPYWLPDAALGNAAGAVAVVSGIESTLALNTDAIQTGLAAAALPGRQQRVDTSGGQWLLDVGHNPSSIALLAERLAAWKAQGRVRMAFALMQRKPLAPLLDLLAPVVDEWFALALDDPQSHPAAAVAEALQARGCVCLGQGEASAAVEVLEARTETRDLIVAAGSFQVVEGFMRLGIGACNNDARGRN